jgi:hypothetical protein
MIEGAPLDYLFVFVPMDVGLNSANMCLIHGDYHMGYFDLIALKVNLS